MNHNSRVGVNAHLARKELLVKVKQWGMEMVRGDVNWPDVEPEQGTFIWNTRKVSEVQQASYIDQLLESFPGSGLDMMLLFDLIDEGHGWGMLQSDTSDKLCVATVRSRLQQQRPVV